MESEYPSAILLFGKEKMINFYHRIILENIGYKGDIISFENPEKAINYIKGITSYFLPEIDPSPELLVLIDLQFCRYDSWQIFNTFRSMAEHKRNWFRFVFTGSDVDFIKEGIEMKFNTLLHFESQSFEWHNFFQFIGTSNKEK
jgi:signal peptidase I